MWYSIPNELIFILQICMIYTLTIVSAFFGSMGLAGGIIIQSVCANLFILKQITLFGLTVTGTDAYTIGSMLGLNLLQELHGKEYAKKAILVNFGTMFFYLLATYIQIGFHPTSSDVAHYHYYILLSITPRLIAASLISFIISQFLDFWLYGFSKRFFTNTPLIIRNYISVSISQLIDTVLFSFLAFYGLPMNIIHLIVFSYLIKFITILLLTPSTNICLRFIKKFKLPSDSSI